MVYQQALASVFYSNEASEPSMEPIRRIQFQVFDGLFSSNVLVGFVSINLEDDNQLMLDCGAGIVIFSEGSLNPVSLAAFLTLSDLDSNHVIVAASVSIANAQQGDEIQLNSLLANQINIQQTDGIFLNLTGEATAMQYQVIQPRI